MSLGGIELRAVYAPGALLELDEIADWTESKFGRERAQQYLSFLLNEISRLSSTPLLGTVLVDRPEYRFLPLRQRGRGHCHVVVYSLGNNLIEILHVFHSAQDWRGEATSALID